jgi:NitT/TauT family transport system substrate-binding protein
MNQGDRTEGRVYFALHFVAQRLGSFGRAGVDVGFVWAETGDRLAKSGQIPALLSGEADLTIGGPMVTMRMRAEGAADLVCFCAAVRMNPWYLASRNAGAPFDWAALSGRTILDVSRITTATIALKWLLRQKGLAESVRLVDGSGDEAADFARVEAGEFDYALHSLHGLAPRLSSGTLGLATSLAAPTGPVPWSAYIAQRAAVAQNPEGYRGFAAAIGEALGFIAASTPGAIADLVAADYPDYPREALENAIALYKAEALWPTDPVIPRADFLHFQAILRDSGWFAAPVDYDDHIVPPAHE